MTQIAAQTTEELRKLIKSTEVKEVCIQPRFGLCESWIKISKLSALELVQSNGSLSDLDLDSFGTFDNGFLYLG